MSVKRTVKDLTRDRRGFQCSVFVVRRRDEDRRRARADKTRDAFSKIETHQLSEPDPVYRFSAIYALGSGSRTRAVEGNIVGNVRVRDP